MASRGETRPVSPGETPQDPAVNGPQIERVLRHLAQAHVHLRPQPYDTAPLRAALENLSAASTTIHALKHHLKALADTTIAALNDEDLGRRALLAETFEDQRCAFFQTITYAPPAAQTLIGENAAAVKVPLPKGGTFCIPPTPLDGEHTKLVLPFPVTAFSAQSEIAQTLETLLAALDHLDAALERMEGNRATLTRRLQSPGGA